MQRDNIVYHNTASQSPGLLTSTIITNRVENVPVIYWGKHFLMRTNEATLL